MKNQKGITMTALVATIVVMLILSGIAIKAIIEDDSLIKKANTSIDNYESSEEEEIVNVSYSKTFMRSELNGEDLTAEKLQEEILKHEKPVVVEDADTQDDALIITFLDTKHVFYVNCLTGNIYGKNKYEGEISNQRYTQDSFTITSVQENSFFTINDVKTSIKLNEGIEWNDRQHQLQWSKTPLIRDSWQKYTGAITSEKNETIYFRVYDIKSTQIKSDEILHEITNIDKDKPTVAFSPDGGKVYTMPTTGNATIKTNVTVSDEGVSGIDPNSLGYAWSTSSSTAPTSWTAFTNGAEISKTDVKENGSWYLWVKFNDNAGTNDRRPNEIKYSKEFYVGKNSDTNNKITFATTTNNWTNEDVTVTPTYGAHLTEQQTLACTGTNGTDYRLNGTTNVVVKTNNKMVTATARDIAGNMITKSLELTKIDKQAPTVSTAMRTTKTTRKISASVGIQDTGSGYYQVVWSYKKNAESNYTVYKTNTVSGLTLKGATQGATTAQTLTCDFTDSGLIHATKYDIKAEVYDVAGNIKTITTSDTTIEINTAITYGTPKWHETTANRATVTVTGAQSGCQLQYQIGGISGAWTNINSGAEIPYQPSGTKVYARLWDGLNQGQNYVCDTIIDTTKPSITLGSNKSEEWAQSKSVTVTVTDNQSMLPVGQTLKYGWSTSTTTAPSGYHAVTLSNTAATRSTSFTAEAPTTEQASYSGKYYLWVVPVTLKDSATTPNVRTETAKSTGTFYIDNTKPTVTLSSTTTKNITFSATDGIGVTGYAVTTSNTAPALNQTATASNGLLNKWVSVTSTTNYNKTLTGYTQNTTYYVWVRDAAGNVSNSSSKTTTSVTTPGTSTLSYTTTWSTTEAKATVAFTTTSGFTIQTSTDGRNWTTQNSITVASGTQIYVRYWDESSASQNYGASYAAVKPILKYTIAYNLNGGSYGTNAPTSANYDSTITIDNPTRTGYTFAGWTATNLSTGTAKYGTSTADTAWSNASTQVTTTKFINLRCVDSTEVTLVANWTANTITISLNKNGGSGGTTTFYYKYDTNKMYSDSSCTTQISSISLPSRTGYTFQKYYGDGTCGGNSSESYIKSDGTWYSDLCTDIYKDATLYAEWTANTYKVTLDNQGATTAGTTAYYYQYNTTKVVNGVTAYYYTDSALTNPLTGGYTISVPSKTGYTFGGYYTGTNGSGTQYVDSSGTCVNNLYTIAGNRTLYAKWTEHTYTIAFNANGGTGSMSNITGIKYTESKTLTANAFTKTGYYFAGWATSATGSVAYNDGASVSKLSSTNGATVTLYAKWNKISGNISITAGTWSAESESKTTATITVTNMQSGYSLYYKAGSSAWSSTTDSTATIANVASGTTVYAYIGNGTHSTETSTKTLSHTHYYVDSGVQYAAATCTTPRYNYKACNGCGYTPGASHIVAVGTAPGHSSTAKLVSNATCTAAAVYHDTCDRCGVETRGNYSSGSALNHSSSAKLVSNATCTAAAVYHDTCDRCGVETRGNYTSGTALGHSYTSKTVSSTYLRTNATCTAAATYYYKCSRCTASSKGDTNTYYSSGSALNHSSTAKLVSNATCTAAAVYHDTCDRCGAETRGNYSSGSALGHSYPDNYTIGTGNEYGFKYKNCKICNVRLETTTTPIEVELRQYGPASTTLSDNTISYSSGGGNCKSMFKLPIGATVSVNVNNYCDVTIYVDGVENKSFTGSTGTIEYKNEGSSPVNIKTVFGAPTNANATVTVKSASGTQYELNTNSLKVTLDANGGSLIAPMSWLWVNRGKTYGDEGSTLYNSACSRTDYTFAGWNTEQDGSGTKVTEGSTVSELNDHTLYAQWTPVSYTLTVNLNGGTAYRVSGSGTTASTSNFTKTFYYQHPEINSYDNMHNLFSTGASNDNSYNSLNSWNCISQPYKANYSFTGWKITSGGGSIINYNGYSGFDCNYKGNVTVTAQWVLSPISVKVTGGTTPSISSDNKQLKFNYTNGGAGYVEFYLPANYKLRVNNSSVTSGGTTINQALVPGYVAKQELSYVSYGRTVDYTNTTGRRIELDVNVRGTCIVTVFNSSGSQLTWKFSGEMITISFNANGGTKAPEDLTVMSGQTVSLYSIPYRQYYKFKGWSKSNTATSATYELGDSASFTSNTTLYAVWERKQIEITVNPNGGQMCTGTSGGFVQGAQKFTMNAGTTHQFAGTKIGATNDCFELNSKRDDYDASMAFYREGYNFIGWKITSGTGVITTSKFYDSVDGYCISYSFNGESETNVTITAQWTKGPWMSFDKIEYCDGGYYVYAFVRSMDGIKSVSFPTWSEENQLDIQYTPAPWNEFLNPGNTALGTKWEPNPDKSGNYFDTNEIFNQGSGKYGYKVKYSNYITSPIKTHIYAMDGLGTVSGIVACSVNNP